MNFIDRNANKFEESDKIFYDSEKIIKYLEKKYAFAMPEAFAKLMKYLENHSIAIDCNDLISNITNQGIEFDSFYPLPNIKAGGKENSFCIAPRRYPLEENMSNPEIEEGWTPNKKDDYMLIADANANNDVLMLGIGENTYGAVYLWDPHESEVDNPAKIFNSVEEMIDNLHFT